MNGVNHYSALKFLTVINFCVYELLLSFFCLTGIIQRSLQVRLVTQSFTKKNFQDFWSRRLPFLSPNWQCQSNEGMRWWVNTSNSTAIVNALYHMHQQQNALPAIASNSFGSACSKHIARSSTLSASGSPSLAFASNSYNSSRAGLVVSVSVPHKQCRLG